MYGRGFQQKMEFYDIACVMIVKENKIERATPIFLKSRLQYSANSAAHIGNYFTLLF